MNVNDLFPSDYLKHSDLGPRGRTVTIHSWETVNIGDELKPVLHFVGGDKPMVLNKTNAMMIAILYGPELDGWVGKTIDLYSATVTYMGKPTKGIRVRDPAELPPIDENRPPIGAPPSSHVQSPAAFAASQAAATRAAHLIDDAQLASLQHKLGFLGKVESDLCQALGCESLTQIKKSEVQTAETILRDWANL